MPKTSLNCAELFPETQTSYKPSRLVLLVKQSFKHFFEKETDHRLVRTLEHHYDAEDATIIDCGIAVFERRMSELALADSDDFEVVFHSSVLINRGATARTEFYYLIQGI